MALQLRTWWQESIAATIFWAGMYYLMGFVIHHPWSLTEFAVATGSFGIAYAAIAWCRARWRKRA
jgi:hypothetical protein